MFYDLNIALPDSAGRENGHVSPQDWSQITKTIEQARQFGYGTIALNQTIEGKVKPEHLKIWTTIPSIKNAILTWNTTDSTHKPWNPTNQLPQGKIRILRRTTVIVKDTSMGHGLTSNGNPTIKEYDIVAVRPTNEKLLFTASSGTWDAIDMISLDMGSRWGFFAKHKMIGQALSFGYSFEINYNAALSDSSSRRQWVSNAASIVRVTRGKGLVWTSAASRAFDLRTPYDITNLGNILQLNADLSKRALSGNPRSLLLHAYTKLETSRAVVAVDRPRDRIDDERPSKKAKLNNK